MIELGKRGTFEALHRVLAFVTADPLPPPLHTAPPKFHLQVNDLKTAMQKLQDALFLLLSDEKEQCMRLRIELRVSLHVEYIKPIYEVVRLASAKERMPHLQPPRSLKNERCLLESAYTILSKIPPHLPTLVEFGLSPTILHGLQQKILSIQNAAKRYDILRSRRHLARNRFCEVLRDAVVIKTDLRTTIIRCCQADPVEGRTTFLRWQALARSQRPVSGRWVPGGYIDGLLFLGGRNPQTSWMLKLNQRCLQRYPQTGLFTSEEFLEQPMR